MGHKTDPLQKWNRRWRNEDFSPRWGVGSIAEQVREVVDDGWLTPGMSVLDLGCGAGPIAAWLAERGFDVLGVDFSPPAIERARKAHGSVPRLAFEVVDVCERRSLPQQFDALLDRGCLHSIDHKMRPAYAENVTAWTRPGSRLLLLMRCRDTTLEKQVEEVRSLLAPEFDLIDFQATARGGPTSFEPLPGSVFRLVRIANR